MITVTCYRCDGAGVVWIEHEPGEPWEVKCVVCKGAGDQSSLVYANVYAVDRVYGGPEEGGWWYDTGYPLGSVRIDPRWDPEIVRSMLERLYADERGSRPRFSTRGGPDVVIRFESHFAEPWPERRPRYE